MYRIVAIHRYSNVLFTAAQHRARCMFSCVVDGHCLCGGCVTGSRRGAGRTQLRARQSPERNWRLGKKTACATRGDVRPAAARGDEDGAAAQHNTVLLHRLVSRPSPAVRTQDIMNNATYHQHSFNYNPRRYLVVNDDTNTNTIKTRVRYPGMGAGYFQSVFT